MLPQLVRFKHLGGKDLYSGSLRGIERELQRIDSSGNIARTPHPKSLGAALTHPAITTDYGEAQLELISTPKGSIESALRELADIHVFVDQCLTDIDEMLWPLSMPPKLAEDTPLTRAYYGNSNRAKIKGLYRRGLELRYGSSMQAISGLHYNFSLPPKFWQAWGEANGLKGSQREITDAGYMAMTRNFMRYYWAIIYSCGASPLSANELYAPEGGGDSAGSLVQTSLGDWRIAGALSLRSGSFGYNENWQHEVRKNYNSLNEYVQAMRQNLGIPHPPFQKLNKIHRDEGEVQIGCGILQIENEFYSPIRLKQGGNTDILPDVLEEQGIGWVEVRCLDCDPFTTAGISWRNAYRLELLLITCALLPSPPLRAEEITESANNALIVSNNGLQPESIKLKVNRELVPFSQELNRIGCEMRDVAHCMGDGPWLDCLYSWDDNNASPAAKIIDEAHRQQLPVHDLGLELAHKMRQRLNLWCDSYTVAETLFDVAATFSKTSISDQQATENSSDEDFDTYLAKERKKRGIAH